MSVKVDEEVQRVYQGAMEARKQSYSPYSNFAVGAAYSMANTENISSGCNIENASYGATVCAERVALWAAKAKDQNCKFNFLVIVTAEKKATLPCALCLQVLAEFCSPDFVIYLANLKGVQEKLLLKELLPKPFCAFKRDG